MHPQFEPGLPIDYVRSEYHSRFHAVLGCVNGRLVAYCGRRILPQSVRARSWAPKGICKCCQTRMRHPYLLTDDLLQCRTFPENQETAASSCDGLGAAPGQCEAAFHEGR